MSQIYTSRRSSIEIVSFDIWHTILNVDGSFSKKRNKLFFKMLNCERLGISEQQFVQKFKEMKREKETQSEREGRHIGFAERMQSLNEKLQLKELDEKTVALLARLHHELHLTQPALLMCKDIPKFLAQLEANGFKIALVSNLGLIDGNTMRYILEFHGLKKFINYEIFSDEIKLAKPNPLIFKKLAELSKRSPNEILHIGDSKQADYHGAIRAGMSALNTPLDKNGIYLIKKYLHLI